MSEKKNQHLVPACYLKNFEADISLKQKTNPKFKSGVYVNDKTFSSCWKLRNVRHSSLTKPYYYNIDGDNPRNPVIEDHLSKIESAYPKFFDEIKNNYVNDENMSFLSYFVILQLMRVEAFIEAYQESYDQIAKMLDMYEGNGFYKEFFKDHAKKQLLSTDLRNIIYPHSTIIYNSTNFPFVTSDNPVVRRQINISDARKIIPKQYLINLEDKSSEFAFFFFPLSPNIAYVSCELIKHCDKVIYADSNLENIFYMNCLSIVNSYSKIYSSIIEPMKGEQELAKILSSKNGIIVKIYTKYNRIISNGSIIYDANSEITLKIDNLEKAKEIKENEYIKLLEIFENGKSIRGMRESKVSSVSYETGVIIIKSNLPFDM